MRRTCSPARRILPPRRLYVVGGLYGNTAALSAIKEMAARETSPLEIVFNGDFHWFDAEPRWFAAIEQRRCALSRLRGNVETEIARDGDIGAGCGCAYPESVSGDVVTRSNEILALLQKATPQAARAAARRAADASRRAGRRACASASCMATRRRWPAGASRRMNWTIRSGRAGSPICGRVARSMSSPRRIPALAALRDFALPGGRLTIVNNGAAGMPNFAGNRRGVITRIATTPSPHHAALRRRARRRSYRRAGGRV